MVAAELVLAPVAGAQGVLAAAATRSGEAVYYLKRFERRPMTKLVQEAVDRYLEPHGGVEGLIERGRATFGEHGGEPPGGLGAR